MRSSSELPSRAASQRTLSCANLAGPVPRNTVGTGATPALDERVIGQPRSIRANRAVLLALRHGVVVLSPSAAHRVTFARSTCERGLAGGTSANAVTQLLRAAALPCACSSLPR